ncbi:hypothetical protein AYO49_00530 [Verrucomicrobiaceae bacterium SCGC AG-212-N21]|nr:hypothetical protein AYO49_00530 [Verrucomicrobiaceae bacterium SCGC AG-212-N21]
MLVRVRAGYAVKAAYDNELTVWPPGTFNAAEFGMMWSPIKDSERAWSVFHEAGAALKSLPPPAPAKKTGFTVRVSDNFNFEDGSDIAGVYATYEEALARSEAIVRKCLDHMLKEAKDPSAVYEHYLDFGDSASIDKTPDGLPTFSSWEFAKRLTDEMNAGDGESNGNSGL